MSSYVLRSATGIARGFDSYDDRIERRAGAAIGTLERDGAATAQTATQWISQNSGKPFFFLLHLFEPHAPYEAAEPYRSRYPLAYDAEIAEADAVVGTFLDDLNPASKRVITALVEPALAGVSAEERFQFERHGYFVADLEDHRAGRPVFNRTVTLRDSWTRK